MSRAHHHYPVASTSYHQPPSDIGSRRSRHPAAAAASSHPDFSQDIYIPESQQELNRVSIESRLLQANGPKHIPDMRRADLTAASSTFDTYDRIGREDDFASTRPAARQPRASNMPAPASSHRQHHEVEEHESLIPGVGRGVRSNMPSQTSYHERIRSLNHDAAQHPFRSSPAKSPYRPGKYSSGYLAPGQPKQAAQSSSSLRPFATSHARPSAALPRQPHVESESESDRDSVTESADSDRINVHTATFNSTGNHRNFAATPAGHTATMTANFRQRPTLGQDTLDRIEFDVHTDTDAEQRPRRDAQPTRTAAATQHQRPRHDPNGPFASPRATNTFGMNAADYQQHLASRTLTSPALRTLIADRSKSPDSPTPAPSIDGVLHPGKNTSGRDMQRQQSQQQQPRALCQNSVSAVSAFEDLARRLQRDVQLTRRGAADAAGTEEADDGSASNSGASGFGPGSQASSARTRVDSEPHKVSNPSHFNSHGFPAHPKTTTQHHDTTSPWALRLPDVTGLTSALGSPVKARDAVRHRPFDSAVGNQDARLEELVNLRCFVDGIQVELDRAGERILNLEQAQEQQSHEFQGLREEMQSALKDVKASKGGVVSEEQLVGLILQKLQSSDSSGQHKQMQQTRVVEQTQSQPVSQASQPASHNQAREARPVEREQGRSQIEVVNRLYAELDKLRMVMEEQYQSATSENRVREQVEPRPQHAAYQHQDNLPNGRDPWDAIEALRFQVLSLAEEVEGLNGLVLQHLIQPLPSASRKRQARSSSASIRHASRYYDEEAHPASEPVQPPPTTRSSPRDQMDIRTDPIDEVDDHHHHHHHRRVSFGRQHRRHQAFESEEEYDATIDAVAENLRVQRERQRRRQRTQPHSVPSPAPVQVEVEVEEEDEISQLADARAARASARASLHHPPTLTHNPTICTVCTTSTKSQNKKASRRARLLAAEHRRQAVELEESILLDAFDSRTSTNFASAKIGVEELATLKVILREHWDEFLHQRMLYSELADELKTMSPGMGKAKRRILAEHVLEAVELLELKAERIERLEKVVASCTDNAREKGESVGEKEEGRVRKQAASRTPSASSGGNRLKHALESFEKRSSTSSPSMMAGGGRNSPPTTIQL